MSTNVERLRDPQQRAERATRILDMAADLLLRHGYRRVTMDDVADGVGIGKGTVYLHWKTREQLFGAVFAREVLYAMDELRQALRQDPQVCLLHNFARAYFLAITNRPLLRGLLLDDAHLVGKLTSSPDTARDERHATMARDYLDLLAKHGLLRDDLPVDQIGYAYQATFEGFLRAGEQHADLLARTVQRAFEREPAIPDTTLREISTATVTLLTALIDADRTASGLPQP
ncbi:TetR/AcrR family transcriptional regulator [Nonomuraea sp. NPDC050536]|uniref:TetR/AcrR family transcriptional regulator n=1 Tax=Nonomuraea sp. NPDC050536 TaxID=3364366 RepID=UPI0037C79F1C